MGFVPRTVLPPDSASSIGFTRHILDFRGLAKGTVSAVAERHPLRGPLSLCPRCAARGRRRHGCRVRQRTRFRWPPHPLLVVPTTRNATPPGPQGDPSGDRGTATRRAGTSRRTLAMAELAVGDQADLRRAAWRRTCSSTPEFRPRRGRQSSSPAARQRDTLQRAEVLAAMIRLQSGDEQVLAAALHIGGHVMTSSPHSQGRRRPRDRPPGRRVPTRAEGHGRLRLGEHLRRDVVRQV